MFAPQTRGFPVLRTLASRDRHAFATEAGQMSDDLFPITSSSLGKEDISQLCVLTVTILSLASLM